MKKLLLLSVMACLSLCSCYNTRILVGNVEPDQKFETVGGKWNHHFVAGLVTPYDSSSRVEDYVGDRKDYRIKTKQNFWNMLVGALTFGIYTPTKTRYYVPVEQSQGIVEE